MLFMSIKTAANLVIALVLLSSCAPASQPANSENGTVVPAQAKSSAVVSAPNVDLPGRLLFARAGDLWVWSGTEGRQITQRGNLSQPTWSPDGSRIAAVRRGPSFSDIVLLETSGGEPLTITDGDSSAPPNSFERARSTIWSFYPAFGPDGSVFYVSQAGPAVGEPASDYNLSLYQTPAAAGGERTQLYASDEGQVGRIAVAADGDMLLAFQPALDPPQVLRYAEGEANPIEGVPSESYDPAVSADGQWLTFAARNNGATDIYIAPIDGGTSIKLTSTGSARSGVLSPDGKWLAFLTLSSGGSSFDLWIAPVTIGSGGIVAGEARAVTTDLHIDVDSGLAWGN